MPVRSQAGVVWASGAVGQGRQVVLQVPHPSCWQHKPCVQTQKGPQAAASAAEECKRGGGGVLRRCRIGRLNRTAPAGQQERQPRAGRGRQRKQMPPQGLPQPWVPLAGFAAGRGSSSGTEGSKRRWPKRRSHRAARMVPPRVKKLPAGQRSGWHRTRLQPGEDGQEPLQPLQATPLREMPRGRSL